MIFITAKSRLSHYSLKPLFYFVRKLSPQESEKVVGYFELERLVMALLSKSVDIAKWVFFLFFRKAHSLTVYASNKSTSCLER